MCAVRERIVLSQRSVCVRQLQCWQVPDKGRREHGGRLVHEREWTQSLCVCVRSCVFVMRVCDVCSARADRSQPVEHQCASTAVLAST
jgi:hypothetical protein